MQYSLIFARLLAKFQYVVPKPSHQQGSKTLASDLAPSQQEPALSVPMPGRSNGLRPIPPPCLGSGSESSGMLLGISSEGSRGPPGGKFCGILGACWGFLGASWRPLGASGGRLGASWGRLGAVSSKGRFVSSLWGPSWVILGALLGRLGGLLARLGAILGVLERS